MKSLLARLRSVLSALTGDFSWNPPGWLGNARARAATHRRTLVAGSRGAAFLAVAGVALYAWHLSAPRPYRTPVKVQAPGLSGVADGKPVPMPLVVAFGDSAAKLDEIGKAVEHGASIEPPVPGRWTWTSDRTLLFQPEGTFDWPAGGRYRIALDRSLFPDRVKLEDYRPGFAAPRFAVTIEGGFYIDPTHPAVPRITGTLRFSHPVAQNDLEAKLALAGKDLGALGLAEAAHPLSVEMADGGRIAYFRSAPVRLPAKESFLRLEVGKGLAPLSGAGLDRTASREVPVPSRSSFLKVSSSDLRIVRNAQGDPEQTLMLETTLGVDTRVLEKNLSVYLLPARDAGQPWESAAEVLKKGGLDHATRVPVSLASREIPCPTLQSARMKLPEGRQVYLRVNGGVAGPGGFALEHGYDTVLAVPAYPREVRIAHDGAILTLSGERKISIVTRGVDAVECRLAKVPAAEINHLISQSSGSFKNPVFSGSGFGEDDLGESFVRKLKVDGSDPAKANYVAFDFSEFLGNRRTAAGYGLFFLRTARDLDLENFPEGESRWSKGQADGDDADERFVLVTDLGLVVKENADHSREVFVASLRNGTPVAGAEAEVMGKNGLPLAKAATDAQGRASLPDVSGLKREREPVAIVVRHGDDLAFLPYAPRDREVDLSRFDTGGLEPESPSQLAAYLFSDRGIYRPGDAVHLGAIVKPLDWKGSPAGIPLEIAVRNPAGNDVKVERLRWPASGLLDWGWTPKESAPTGPYTVGIYTVQDGGRGAQLGETTVRIEEFLPDRMKIAAVLDRPVPPGWISPEALKVRVSLRNLYGTPAEGHRVSGAATLDPSPFSFEAWPGYLFRDPVGDALRRRKEIQLDLADATTDAEGAATLPVDLGALDGGAYRLSYVARGFEKEGGRSVTAGGNVLVSPRPFLVGCKADGRLDYIQAGNVRVVSLLAVDSGLKPAAPSGLTLSLAEERYVSALARQPNGDYAYESRLQENDLGTTPLSLPASAGGYSYSLPTRRPGTFVARVNDADGLCLAAVRFTVVGAANLTRSIDRNAELVAHIPQRTFHAGEEIPVSIVAPYAGAGLITIERDRVYAQKWFRAASTASEQRITIPSGFDGNGYLHVTFLRAIDSPEILMSPLSTAVVPFTVDRDKRTVKIDLQAPEKMEPGRPLDISYRADRPCKVVVFAVDEGILRVARYATPDPLGCFLQKRALQVRTTQLLDLVLPEFSLDRRLAAAGGDGDEDLLAANLNPFQRKGERPAAFWSGVLDASPAARTVRYDVPDSFHGTLRIMAVAVSPDAAGSAERSALVRGPFVIAPNAPAFVAPGDEFEVSVSVANVLEGSGPEAKVALAAAVSPRLKLLDGTALASPLTIPEGKEATVRLRLKAAEGDDAPGDASVALTANDGGKSSRLEVHLSVRPPAPFRTTVASGVLRGAQVDVPLPRRLWPQYRRLRAVCSPLPLGLARGLADYLADYPHLCTEQLASRGFPLVVLDPQGAAPTRAEREKGVAAIVDILASRQNDQGAIGLWGTESGLRFDFPSVYAMHFLTEAREAGYAVPDDLLARGLDHLQQIAADDPSNLVEARLQAYAIYLLARNGVVAGNQLDRTCGWLDRSDPAKAWHNDLAGLYCASAYSLLQDRKDAARLLAGFRFGHPSRGRAERDDFYTDLGRDGQYLALVARHFPERLASLTADDLTAMAEPIVAGAYTTHGAAYAILGLQAYATAVKGNGDGAKASEILSDGSARLLAGGAGLAPEMPVSGDARAVRFAKDGRTPLAFYQVISSGFDRELPKEASAQGIEVQREYRGRDGKVVATAKLGEELTVHLRLRSIDGAFHDNVAVVDLLPGGFEVVDGTANGSPGSLRPDSTDVREDRVVVYGSASVDAREFVYRIKAVNRGRYAVPPVQAESMYRPEIAARGVAGTLGVEE